LEVLLELSILPPFSAEQAYDTPDNFIRRIAFDNVEKHQEQNRKQRRV
jgi:hypothetical protein